MSRLEMDPYDQAMVLQLIETHLEMSAALRRDIFDTETVRTFAGKVQTHESLWMLTLFTYADIRAVHPDALTPWKAENLWRLFDVDGEPAGPQCGPGACAAGARRLCEAWRRRGKDCAIAGEGAAGQRKALERVCGGLPGAVCAHAAVEGDLWAVPAWRSG